MLYVGVHKGSLDDGYISSSKPFNEAYDASPDRFTRQVIAEGDFNDMLSLENAILSSSDAAKSDSFYNLCNGRSGFTCTGHTEKTREQMSRTWKRKGVFNCDQKKAIETWRGSKHSDDAKKKMSEAQKKHSSVRSERMAANNPMKDPAVIQKMLETRRRNKERNQDECTND